MLMLDSADLESKWGFNDGDMPEWWCDWCDGRGYAWERMEFPWAALVREFLLPALGPSVEVYEIETCHNPIRSADPVPDLQVHVPAMEVLRVVLREAGLSEPPRSGGVWL